MAVRTEQTRRGWKLHRKQENALLDDIRRNRTIPVHGFTETDDGIMPPPYPAAARLPFDFEVAQDASSPQLYIVPSVVYSQWTADTEINIPRVHYLPVKPTIGGQSIFTVGENRPGASLTTGLTNHVFLELDFSSYDYDLGGVDWDGAGGYGYELVFSLDDSTGGAVVDGTAQADPPPGAWGIQHFEKEQNYTLNTAAFVVYPGNTSFAWPTSETAGFYNIYAGHVTLDDDGQITSLESLIKGGPVWAPAIPRHKDSASQKSISVRAMPEAPTTGGSYDPETP